MLIQSEEELAVFDRMCKAVKDNDVKLVVTLLEAGFNPNCYEDQDKFTLLHFAAAHGALDVIPWLMNAGGKPRSKTADGLTVFDFAKDLKTIALLSKLSYEIPEGIH